MSSDKYMVILIVALIVVVAAVILFFSVEPVKQGNVDVIRIVNPECESCSADIIVNSLEAAGMKLGEDRKIYYKSNEAIGLIEKYNITIIPAVVFSKELDGYTNITEFLDSINTTKVDGMYAVSVFQPPYTNLSINKTEGLVDIIYLNDSTCSSCYNVLVHRAALILNFGVHLDRELSVDVNSPLGKELLERYNITAIPTIIVSKDIEPYSNLLQIWPTLGTHEEDGYYVFRNLSQVGSYRDIETGKLVIPI